MSAPRSSDGDVLLRGVASAGSNVSRSWGLSSSVAATPSTGALFDALRDDAGAPVVAVGVVAVEVPARL